jgi:hypothetical protein
MAFEPRVKFDVEYFAVPLLSVFVARTVEPFWKETLPVGTLLPDWGETVALKATSLPDADGLIDELSVVVVATLLMPVNPNICSCLLLATKT